MTEAPGTARGAHAAGPATTDATEVTGERSSIGALLTDVSKDISELMRQEVELAKAEARASATRAGKGAGMLGGAGVAGHLALVFLSVAGWWALGDVIGRGWSALVVMAIWAVVAGVLAMMGRKEMQAVKGLDKTTESVKKIPPALKGHEEQNR